MLLYALCICYEIPLRTELANIFRNVTRNKLWMLEITFRMLALINTILHGDSHRKEDHLHDGIVHL